MPAHSPRSQLPLHLAALSYAHDFVGVTEVGDNRGPAVEFFQRAAGIPPGSAWCAAVVNACAELGAAIRNQEASPLEKVPLQGYVPSYWQYGVLHGWDVEWPDVAAGDLFLLWNNSLGRYAHMGFVDAVRPLVNRYTTVEGNTNLAGGREGLVMARRERRAGSRSRFLRWA
jgi:hypothetical protein